MFNRAQQNYHPFGFIVTLISGLVQPLARVIEAGSIGKLKLSMIKTLQTAQPPTKPVSPQACLKTRDNH
jgi:hypothetical protein